MTTQAAKDKKLAAVQRDIDRQNRIVEQRQWAIVAANNRLEKLNAKKSWLEQMPVDEETQKQDVKQADDA